MKRGSHWLSFGALILLLLAMGIADRVWLRASAQSATQVSESAEAVDPPLHSSAQVPSSHNSALRDSTHNSSPAVDRYRQGVLLAKAGRYDEALHHFRAAEKLDPNNAANQAKLGQLFAVQGQLAEAIVHFDRAIQLDPKDVDVANNLAWLLSVDAHDAHRDGRRAVELAERICQQTNYSVVDYLNTLAAAYAEVASFDRAIEAARRALQLSAKANADPLANVELNRRLALYESKQPLRFGNAPLRSASEAEELFLQTIEALWENAEGCELIDWMARTLAASSNDGLRSPVLAERLAAELCRLSDQNEPRYMATWAASHAALGRFDQAARLVIAAQRMARDSQNHDLQRLLEEHLELYRRQLPLRIPDEEPLSIPAGSPSASLAGVHYLAGKWLADLQRTDESLAAYRRALQLDPNSQAANRALARRLMWAGDSAAAVVHFRTAVAAGDSPQLRHELAVALCEANQLEEAIHHFDQVLRETPNDAKLHANLALCLLRLGKAEPAVRHLAQATQLNPALHDAANNLAWIRATHPDAAMRNGAAAVQIAEQLCKDTRFETIDYLGTLAAAYAEAGNFEQAIKVTHRAIAALPAGSSPERTQLAGRLELFEQERPVRGAQQANLDAAELLLMRGDTDAASRQLVLALENDPTNVNLHNRLAVSLAEGGDYRDAEHHLYRALRLDPKNASSHGNLAVLHLKRGRTQEATNHFREAIDLDAGRRHDANTLAWILATHDDARIRNADDALHFAELANAGNHDDPHLLDTLAAALAESRQFDRAATTIRRALDRADRNKESAFVSELDLRLRLYENRIPFRNVRQAHIELGRLALTKGEAATAEAQFRKALTMGGPDAALCSNLGLAALEQQKFDEAVDRFREALAIDSDFLPAANNLAYLLANEPNRRRENLPAALALAFGVCERTNYQDVGYLDTLASVLASAGNFEHAMRTLQAAIRLLNSDDAETQTRRSSLERRLQQYERLLQTPQS